MINLQSITQADSVYHLKNNKYSFEWDYTFACEEMMLVLLLSAFQNRVPYCRILVATIYLVNSHITVQGLVPLRKSYLNFDLV